MPNLTPPASGVTPADPPSLVPDGGGGVTPSDPPSVTPNLPGYAPEAPPDIVPPYIPPLPSNPDAYALNDGENIATQAFRDALFKFPGYKPVLLRKGLSGIGGNYGEMNELVMMCDNPYANILSLCNTSSHSALSTLTFRAANQHEKMALGYIGSPFPTQDKPDTCFIEIHDVDNSLDPEDPLSPGIGIAPAFNFLVTSYYGPDEGVTYGQYSRWHIAVDGAMSFNTRAGIPWITLNKEGDTTTILGKTNYNGRSYNSFTSQSVGANAYGSLLGEFWSPSGNEGTFTHYGNYTNITLEGANNVTTTDGGGGAVAGYFGIVKDNTGTLAKASALVAQTRHVSVGTWTQANAIYIPSPQAGGTSPITNAHGILIEPIKQAGVTTAYGVRSVGTSDLNLFAGKTRIGSTDAPTVPLDIVGQTQIAGQSLVDDNSAVTRGLGDVRYARIVSGFATANQDVTNSAAFTDSTHLAVALGIGTWDFETVEIVGSSAFASAGAKSQLVFTGTGTPIGSIERAGIANTDPVNAQPSYAGSSASVGSAIEYGAESIFVRRKGRVVVTVAGTLKIQFAQYAAVSGQYARMIPGSFLRATKVA